jgi:hypothetical protein
MTKKTVAVKKTVKPKAQPQRPRPTADPAVRAYVLARTDPFHDDAAGARVPDEYSFPTEVRKLHSSFRFSTGAAASTDFSFVATNNPLIGCVYNSTGITTNAGSIIVPYGVVNNATVQAATMRYAPAASKTALRRQLAQVRVVGWGVRVKCLDNYATTGGKIIMAAIPGSGTLDTNGHLNGVYEVNGGGLLESSAAIMDRVVLNQLAVPWDTNQQVDGGILAMPSGAQVSMAELISSGSIVHVGRVTSPHAHWFKNTSDSAPSADGVTLGDYNATVGTINAAPAGYTSDLDSLGGWSNCAFRMCGMPANTDIEVEMIYHLEGTYPVNVDVGSSTGAYDVYSATSAAFVMPALMDAVSVTSSKEPFFRLIPSAATVNRVFERVKNPKTFQDKAMRMAITLVGNAIGMGGIVAATLG